MTEQKTDVFLHIAYIGGGSRGWARTLMNDLAISEDLSGEVLLYDIDLEAARLNERFGNWIQTQPGVTAQWHYRTVATLEEALKGADFVFISIQPGPLEMMAHEIAVAEKYGMFFPVGDTTGAPGLMRGLRSTIIFAGFAQAIVEHAPEAWVINYSNPMSVCTRTLTKVAPGLKVFGCCHEVFSTQHLLAWLATDYLKLQDVPTRDEIRVNVQGINHFTWVNRAFYRDHDLLEIVRQHISQPGMLRPYTQEEVEATHDWFHNADQIKFELFKRYNILGAAGDRHLAEFMPGFTHSPEVLFRWGIIRTPMSYRFGYWKNAPQVVLDYLEGRSHWQPHQSGEEALRQIRALLGFEDLVTNVNMENVGQIPNLPLRSVVETNAFFSHNLVTPLAAGALVPGVQTLVARHIANQEMIIDAALERNKDLAFQAVFNDPTTNLPIDKAWEMFNEIGLPEGFW